MSLSNSRSGVSAVTSVMRRFGSCTVSYVCRQSVSCSTSLSRVVVIYSWKASCSCSGSEASAVRLCSCGSSKAACLTSVSRRDSRLSDVVFGGSFSFSLTLSSTFFC